MDNGKLDSKVAVNFVHDVLLGKAEYRLKNIRSRTRTKAQLYLVGDEEKELYVIVGDHNKSTRVLLEHPLTIPLKGVRPDLTIGPYLGSVVKNAAVSRKISVSRQHTVYVDSTEALDRLFGWYSGSGMAVASVDNQESTEKSLDRSGPRALHESSKEQKSEPRIDEDIDFASKAKYPLEDTQQRAIKTRRGQPDFRKRIFEAYDNKCSVTGCAVPSVLEAGHIIPHAEETDWDVSNGLPLRADIHTLFDLRLLAVGPGYLIQVSNTLTGSDYEKLHGRTINLPKDVRNYPSPEKLAKHFEGFEERNSDE